MNIHYKKFNHLLLSLLFLALFCGCAIQLVSARDEVTLQQMETLAQEVDHFFIQLSYIPASVRDYKSSKSRYLDIEVKLNALKMRQEIREMNELTLKQVEIAIELWTKDRKRHQVKENFSDFMVKRYRSQYKRLFLAMIKGEEVKEKQPTK
jgi:hypothetical protein